MTLIVILDDTTSEIYYAQLVEEESTVTVMVGLGEVIERKGLFCALYSDRGRFLAHSQGGEARWIPIALTQVGQAPRELGIQMIPACSAPGAGTIGAQLWYLAGATPAGTPAAGDGHVGSGQRFSTGALPGGA